jgi:trehalose-6-phosphate synthase
VNEFLALKNIFEDNATKYGIIISENIGFSSGIKGAFRVNPYNIHHIVNALDRVYFMKHDERSIRFKRDLEHVLQNTTLSWIKNFFLDLKRATSVNIF